MSSISSMRSCAPLVVSCCTERCPQYGHRFGVSRAENFQPHLMVVQINLLFSFMLSWLVVVIFKEFATGVDILFLYSFYCEDVRRYIYKYLF